MAKKKRKKSASRGSVNNIILQTLVNGDKYGYEIIKEVEEYSDGKIELKQPSLYSSLSRFEEKGFVSSYWGDSDIGGRRHYYHLTDKGLDFYNTTILKHNNTSPSEIQDDTYDITVADTENEEDLDNQIEKDDVELEEDEYSDDLDDKNEISDNEDFNDNELWEKTIIHTTPIEENDIPAIINFEPKEESDDLSYIHPFKNTTPIEQELTSIRNITNNNSNLSPVEQFEEEIQNSPNSVSLDDVWDNLSYNAKLNTRRCRQTPFKKLHYIRPKKAKKVILDTDGIYKLRDADYVSNKSKKYEPVIIDNVGKRLPDKSINYATYSNSTKQMNKLNNTSILDLSDEERRKRNENFLAKFNSLTKSKYVETKAPEPISEPKKEPEIDYRSKLDRIIATEERNNKIKMQEMEENNIFNYDFDESNSPSTQNFDNLQPEEDKFIDFEPVEFDIKTDDRKYIDNISNFNQSQNNIKFNRYQTKSSNAILSDKSYVLINKVKCIFGFILLFLFAIEFALSYVIFNKFNLITDSDITLIFISGIVALICSLSFIIPAFVNPNEHKSNNFKLKYSLILGFLTFVISVVLVYCINALMGFELDNFKFYAVKLILPLVLTFNFVLTPPIYAMIIKCKKFYD